jgi:hypothetical protein
MVHASTIEVSDRDARHDRDEHHRQTDGPTERLLGETPGRAHKRDGREGKPSLD